MILLPILKPSNCMDCPCLSGYGTYCFGRGIACKKAFSQEEKNATLKAYPDAYTPDWCPIIEMEDDGK